MYFLDIEMPLLNGIEIANIIRNKEEEAYNIFISSHSNYVFESLVIRPFAFIEKKRLYTFEKKEIFRLIQDYKTRFEIYNDFIDGVNREIIVKKIIKISKDSKQCIIYTKGKEWESKKV